jgi:dienelactone hydrolase
MRGWILAGWLALATASLACAQNTPAKFSLELNGQVIGSAEYRFTPKKSGFEVDADYSFSLASIHAECMRDGELGPDYEVKSDTLTVNLAGAHQTAKFTAEPKDSKFVFNASAAGQEVDNSFPLHPHTAVLNDFDPSGVQEILYLAAAQAAPTQDYWVLLAKGRGIQAPVRLVSVGSGEGTLNGAKVALKNWQLTVGEVVFEISADPRNNLMQAAVPSQSLAYTRIGFVSGETDADEAPAAPPPVAPTGPNEQAVSFTSDGLTFPAILTLPKNRTGPVPIVVLVHGSGPHDADETIGPNKPFLDLAQGLATYGIATLRYEKRTHFAPASFAAHPDVERETVLDAVAALEFASSRPEVDPKRVFLLGHSLGGMVAPVIAGDRLRQAPGSVRGIIFLAAPALPIEGTIERQVTAAAQRNGEDAAQLDALKKQWEQTFARINDPSTPESESLGVSPLLAPEGYWRSLVKQDPAAELKQLRLPALLLRGTKDIQVSEGDYNALANANTAPGSESKELDGLNHLLMPVTGESTGADYFTPSHVDPQVVRIIADWIDSLK